MKTSNISQVPQNVKNTRYTQAKITWACFYLNKTKCLSGELTV